MDSIRGSVDEESIQCQGAVEVTKVAAAAGELTVYVRAVQVPRSPAQRRRQRLAVVVGFGFGSHKGNCCGSHECNGVLHRVKMGMGKKRRRDKNSQ